MTLMQGGDLWMWEWMAVLFAVMGIAGTWYFVITGRDRAPRKQRRGERTLERYGDIEEDRSPVSKFLIWTYVGVGIWAVAYLIWTGIHGFAG